MTDLRSPRALVLPFGVSDDGRGLGVGIAALVHAFFRVAGQEVAFVQVLAHAVYGVPRSAKLLTELNDINRRAQWTKVFWSDGYVISEANLHWTDADRDGLERLMNAICAMCDDIGPMIAAVYGGSTPLTPQPESAEDGRDAA